MKLSNLLFLGSLVMGATGLILQYNNRNASTPEEQKKGVIGTGLTLVGFSYALGTIVEYKSAK